MPPSFLRIKASSVGQSIWAMRRRVSACSRLEYRSCPGCRHPRSAFAAVGLCSIPGHAVRGDDRVHGPSDHAVIVAASVMSRGRLGEGVGHSAETIVGTWRISHPEVTTGSSNLSLLMKIGELAQVAQCTVETVRYYERKDCCPPRRARPPTTTATAVLRLTGCASSRNCRAGHDARGNPHAAGLGLTSQQAIVVPSTSYSTSTSPTSMYG